jgi:hypothetical protein
VPPEHAAAVAFDPKAFFAVTGKDPVEVAAADVFDFPAHHRGDRTVVRLADRESGSPGCRLGPVRDPVNAAEPSGPVTTKDRL